jgi:hypothetical protein
MIRVRDDLSWSAASWLFSWVLRTLAEQAGCSGLVARLESIEETNVQLLALSDLPANELASAVAAFRDLPLRARDQLGAVLAESSRPVRMDIPTVIASVESLSEMVAREYS